MTIWALASILALMVMRWIPWALVSNVEGFGVVGAGSAAKAEPMRQDKVTIVLRIMWRIWMFIWLLFILGLVCVKSPNDPKLSDGGGWRAGCAGEGGGAASVTAGAVR
jgi:hypothetical protein